ncbi:MAG TPA: DUF4190 domain-containing protein [Bacillus sp. (in: firmicutes)]|nr:DUF4190 domain-containing protein [Bacillus sp. (in: firmicutes)]
MSAHTQVRKDRLGSAVVSLIMGIFSIIFLFLSLLIPVIGIIFFILMIFPAFIGFPLGIIARKSSNGRGMAIAGIVLNSISLFAMFLVVILGLIAFIVFQSFEVPKDVDDFVEEIEAISSIPADSSKSSTDEESIEVQETNTEEMDFEQPGEMNSDDSVPLKSISDSDIESFMEDYLYAGMDAIRENDFTYIEPFLDPQGESYQESQNYIEYLNSKNISEELLNYQIQDIVQLDEESYKVLTYEEYDIQYGDGTNKIKSYNSEYLVKVLADGSLAMNKLLKTDELSSETLN